MPQVQKITVTVHCRWHRAMWVRYTKDHRNFNFKQIRPQIFFQEVSKCMDTAHKILLNIPNNPRHTVLRVKSFLWSFSGSTGSECSGQRRSCASALLLSIWAPWYCEVPTAEQLRSAAPRGEYLWRHTSTPVSAPEQLFDRFGARGKAGFANTSVLASSSVPVTMGSLKLSRK